MDKNDLLYEAKRLSASIKQFYEHINKVDDNGWSDVYSRTAEDQYIRNQLSRAAQLLKSAEYILRDTTAPVKDEGVLLPGENGRYTLNGQDITSGYPIEYLVYDDFDEVHLWRSGRIEYYDGDYRIYNYPEIQLAGLRVRIKH